MPGWRFLAGKQKRPPKGSRFCLLMLQIFILPKPFEARQRHDGILLRLCYQIT
jgi:hypothetical protein